MDTPIPPSENLPPATPVSPPVSPSPAVAPAISGAVKTAGFFTGKVIAAIIGMAVVGGGIGVGYFVFPEPFYNTVGKYIGLPAPVAMEERAAGEENSAKETDNNTVDSEKTTGGENLFDSLPGADANIALHIKISAEARSIFEDFEKKIEEKNAEDQKKLQDNSSAPSIIKELSGGASRPIPVLNMFGVTEENKKMFSAIEEIALVGKQDFSSPKNRTLSPEEEPVTIAIKVKIDQETFIAEKLKQANENGSEVISIENKGNGLFIIQMLKNPLQGKFIDNPMYQNIVSATGDLAISFNVKEVITAWLKENAPSDEELAADPKIAQQFELMKLVQSLVLTGSLQKDDSEKPTIVLQIRIDVENEQHATDALAFIQPQLSGAIMLIPPDVQPFVKIDSSQEQSIVSIQINIHDVETVVEKIFAALEASRQPHEMTKPLTDESPADLPNLNQPDPSVLDGKIRRKKN